MKPSRVFTTTVSLALTMALAHPAAGVAQDAQKACPAGDTVPALGIDRVVCIGGSCAINVDSDEGIEHRFSTEPRVGAVSGPAAAVLESGDVIVAIDGLPITTRAGGRRLANPAAGAATRLSVRRNGRELVLDLMPEPGCRTGALDVRTKGVRS